MSWLAWLWIKEWTVNTLQVSELRKSMNISTFINKSQDVKFVVPSQGSENARSEVRAQKAIADAAGLGRAERPSWRNWSTYYETVVDSNIERSSLLWRRCWPCGGWSYRGWTSNLVTKKQIQNSHVSPHVFWGNFRLSKKKATGASGFSCGKLRPLVPSPSCWWPQVVHQPFRQR